MMGVMSWWRCPKCRESGDGCKPTCQCNGVFELSLTGPPSEYATVVPTVIPGPVGRLKEATRRYREKVEGATEELWAALRDLE